MGKWLWAVVLALGVSQASTAEKYFILEISHGGGSKHDAFTEDGYKTLKAYAEKERALTQKAMREIYPTWTKSHPKKRFPLAPNTALLNIRNAGTAPSIEAAKEKIYALEDRVDQQEMAKEAMIMRGGGSTVSKRIVAEQAVLVSMAMDLLKEKLASLKIEAGLGERPVKGLLADELKKDPRFEMRRVNRSARKALAYLVANGSGGSWSGGNGSPPITACVAGLTFLAAAPKGGPFVPVLNKIKANMTRSWANKDGSVKSMIFNNWFLGFRGLFLAEYYAHYPMPDVKKALEETVDLLLQTQNQHGCWFHDSGRTKQYEPGINATGVQCLATLGLAQSFGISVDQDKLKKALGIMSTQAGKVGYSHTNGHFAPGRTGGMAWAYFCCDQEGTARFKNMMTIAHAKMVPVKNDHASPALHIFWRGLFSYMRGPEGWNHFWKHFGDRIIGLQQEDGSFIQAPWADADMEKACGPNYCTAMYGLMLTLPRGNLRGFFKVSQPQAQKAAEDGRKAFLGIRLKQGQGGLEVLECIPGGPASMGGLVPGVLLTRLNGKDATTMEKFQAVLDATKPGDTVIFSYKKAARSFPKRTRPMFAMPGPKDGKPSGDLK